MTRRSTILRSTRLARKERRRIMRHAAWCGAGILLAFAGLLYLFNMPRFLIAEIEVRGAAETEIANEVMMFAERTLAGTYFGLVSRAHPFFYPKGALAAQVLSAFPQFARVSFSRQDSSALRIEITERAPVALWCAEDGCAYLDKEGIVFAEAASGSERLYYQLKQEKQISFAGMLGEEAIEPARLGALLSFFAQLERKELFPVQALFEENGGGVVITLRNGARFFVHEDEGYDIALKRLEILLDEDGLIPRQGDTNELGVDYIDLRYGNKIYFKPR